MKHLLILLAFLLVQLDLQAGEQTLTHIKVTYQAANGGLPQEVETDALIGNGYTRMPLKLINEVTWIVELAPNIEENILSAQILDGAKVVAADYGPREALNFLSIQTPLKFSTDIVLVKNSAYKVSVNISKLPTEANPEADKAAANQPKPVPLTAGEISKLELSYSEFTNNYMFISGHNPFEKIVEGGIIEITIPKTDSTQEIKREYSFDLSAKPLAEFETRVSCNLTQFIKGQKPTFTIKKLQFKP